MKICHLLRLNLHQVFIAIQGPDALLLLESWWINNANLTLVRHIVLLPLVLKLFTQLLLQPFQRGLERVSIFHFILGMLE
jgi:hypothetical protein